MSDYCVELKDSVSGAWLPVSGHANRIHAEIVLDVTVRGRRRPGRIRRFDEILETKEPVEV